MLDKDCSEVTLHGVAISRVKRLNSDIVERKKLHPNLNAEFFERELLWKRLRLTDVESPFSAPTSIFDILLLPELAKPETMNRHFKSLCLLCISD